MADPGVTHPMRGPNRLKLGVFCANTVGALTTIREQFAPTWDECLHIARMADDMGLEAIVPIARWKGYVDDDDAHRSHAVLDPFTYAAAIAQATRRIGIVATTHAPTVHPLIVAKQAATIDAISHGRFAMNVVGGWNRREFDMFGIDLLPHDDRYAYLAEWLGLIRRLWSEDAAFDYESAWFRMKGALSHPRPVRGGDVPIINAGFSDTGMRFAAKHSDIGLIGLFGEDVHAWTAQVARYRSIARDEFARTIQVWTNAQLVVRDSDAEASAFVRHYAEEHADHAAIDSFVSTLARENNVAADSEQMRFMRRTVAIGSGMLIAGSADTVARTLADLSAAGVDGVIISAVDPVDSLHRLRRDVLPVLELAGMRLPADR